MAPDWCAMIFGLNTETRNDPEYVRNVAFWVRRLFDLTQHRFETITATQSVKVSRTVYLIDTTAGSVTITLPTAREAKGEWLAFKKIIAANSLIIDGDAAETIDGSATKTYTARWDFVRVVSDGTNWYVA